MCIYNFSRTRDCLFISHIRHSLLLNFLYKNGRCSTTYVFNKSIVLHTLPESHLVKRQMHPIILPESHLIKPEVHRINFPESHLVKPQIHPIIRPRSHLIKPEIRRIILLENMRSSYQTTNPSTSSTPQSPRRPQNIVSFLIPSISLP